jgi:hypothetical protein
MNHAPVVDDTAAWRPLGVGSLFLLSRRNTTSDRSWRSGLRSSHLFGISHVGPFELGFEFRGLCWCYTCSSSFTLDIVAYPQEWRKMYPSGNPWKRHRGAFLTGRCSWYLDSGFPDRFDLWVDWGLSERLI